MDLAAAKEQWKKFTYQDTLPANYSAFRKLLEEYSHIPSDEVETHLYKIVRPNPNGGMKSNARVHPMR